MCKHGMFCCSHASGALMLIVTLEIKYVSRKNWLEGELARGDVPFADECW